MWCAECGNLSCQTSSSKSTARGTIQSVTDVFDKEQNLMRIGRMLQQYRKDGLQYLGKKEELGRKQVVNSTAPGRVCAAAVAVGCVRGECLTLDGQPSELLLAPKRRDSTFNACGLDRGREDSRERPGGLTEGQMRGSRARKPTRCDLHALSFSHQPLRYLGDLRML